MSNLMEVLSSEGARYYTQPYLEDTLAIDEILLAMPHLVARDDRHAMEQAVGRGQFSEEEAHTALTEYFDDM